MDLRYKNFDVKEVQGIKVYTYWKLMKQVPGPGYICIPLRLKREDDQQQVLICLKAFRKAMALRIISKNRSNERGKNKT